jgi:DNA-binding MarR family transcriptional regulator
LKRNPGLRVGKVASVLELAHFSATRLVQRLEAEGLLVREVDPRDRRAVRLSLSEKARRLIVAIEDGSYNLVQAYAAGRPDAEVAKFIQVAESLDKVLGVADRAEEAVEG